MSRHVLIAGFATRHVARSAHRAGFLVSAVDHFCDLDLEWYTRDRIRFEELEDLPDAIAEICSRHRFDFLVLTSGAEDLPAGLPILGTPRDIVGKFLDKLATQHFFEELGVPVPGLLPGGEYPAFFKPRRGAGGWRNAVIRSDAERQAWEELYPSVPYIRQKVVGGRPASVCCITDGSAARAIASNEQVLRGIPGAEFGFCGSVTPCTHPLAGVMTTAALRIAAASGCRGTIGIDFMLGEDCLAIEINPRFQATVDTVEAATGCNLFSLHAGACSGNLPAALPVPGRFAARRILFSERDLVVRGSLARLSPIVADIPRPGTGFEEGQAIVSVYGSGPTREAALSALDKNITTVQQYLR